MGSLRLRAAQPAARPQVRRTRRADARAARRRRVADRRRLLHEPHRARGRAAGGRGAGGRPEARVGAADRRTRTTRRRARRGLRVARLISMPSVVFYGEESSLVALRAVGEGYPLRGRLKMADRPFGPARHATGIPGPGEAWADSRLLAKLGAAVGARLRVGAHRCGVTRVLDYRPDQGSGFADLSATLLINLADVPATQLIQPGSRVSRAPCCSPASRREVDGFRDWLEQSKQRGERVAGDRRRQPADPRVRRPRGTVPVAREPGERAAVRDCGGDVGATLRAAAPRQRRPDEMHGCLAALRAAQTVAQLVVIAVVDGRGRHRARLRRAVGPRLAAARPAARRPAAAVRRRVPARASSRPSSCWSASHCRRCCS